MKKKITIVTFTILFIFVMLMITDKLTNNKISNSISIGYLYLTSSKKVAFEGMIIKSPYYFIKNKDQTSLILVKFPNNDSVLFFEKIELLTPDVFYNSYTYRLKKMEFHLINKATKKINKKLFYTLSGTNKSDTSEYLEYVYIPSQHVIIEYSGVENGKIEFWKILQSIKFNSIM